MYPLNLNQTKPKNCLFFWKKSKVLYSGGCGGSAPPGPVKSMVSRGFSGPNGCYPPPPWKKINTPAQIPLDDIIFLFYNFVQVFLSQSRLNYHIQYVHSAVKPFPCTLCEKSYKRRNELQEFINNFSNFKKDKNVFAKYSMIFFEKDEICSRMFFLDLSKMSKTIFRGVVRPRPPFPPGSVKSMVSWRVLGPNGCWVPL